MEAANDTPVGLRRRVRERGVRVRERLELLALVLAEEADARLEEVERERLAEVDRALAAVRDEAGLP